MTKLRQIRFTTYSDPRAAKPSQGNLISMYGDEVSFYGPQETTMMEVIAKDSARTIAIGDSGQLNVGFVGTANGGFRFRIGLKQGGVFVVLHSSEVSSNYSDRPITLTIPKLDDPSITSYQLFYSIESGDGSQGVRTETLLKTDGTPFFLDVNGVINIGRSFGPTEFGTVSRIQDGSKIIFTSTPKVCMYGTSGAHLLPSGTQGHQDFFPYFIFNIPNAANGNYVFKVNVGKSDKGELGVPPVQPDLVILNPFPVAPVPYEEVYLDLAAGINKPEPMWSFSGALNQRGYTLPPARYDAKFGTVEYDIPDTVIGPVMLLLSAGLPYAREPYRDDFGGINYRDREKLAVVSSPSIYVKGEPAATQPVAFRELMVDLSEIYSTPARNYTIDANFGQLALFGNISKRTTPRATSFSYPVKPNVSDTIQIVVTTDYDTYSFRGSVPAGADTHTIRVRKDGAGVPVTTLPPTTVTLFGSVTSSRSMRQAQSINPWQSEDITFMVSAYNGSASNPVVFNSSEIGIRVTGLPTGASLTLLPTSASGVTVTYRGAILNPSGQPLPVGQYSATLTPYRISGMQLGSTEVFSDDRFDIYLEPRLT